MYFEQGIRCWNKFRDSIGEVLSIKFLVRVTNADNLESDDRISET